MLTLVLVLATTLPKPTLGGSRASQNRERASDAIVRLKPSAFPNLSKKIQAELERRGCLVPQSYAARGPHNVVSGRFTSQSQIDVAVLCSKDRISTLLVFRGGSIDSVAELHSAPEKDQMQVIGPAGAVGYSWVIEVANPEYIREHFERYGGPLPPPYDHDGINDIFAEKGSVILYWNGGVWLHLAGSD